MKNFEINVLGEKWFVEFVKTMRSGDEDHLGVCHYEERKIEVQKSLSPELKSMTLFHELFHAVLYESSFPVTSINKDLEEIAVDQLSKFLIKNFHVRLKNDI